MDVPDISALARVVDAPPGQTPRGYFDFRTAVQRRIRWTAQPYVP
jgi:hypothetical protein